MFGVSKKSRRVQLKRVKFLIFQCTRTNTTTTSTNNLVPIITQINHNNKNDQLIRKILRNLLNYSSDTINNIQLLIESINRTYSSSLLLRKRLTRVHDLNILKLNEYNIERAIGQYLLNEIIYIHNTLLQLQHQQQLHLLSTTTATTIQSTITTISAGSVFNNYIEPQRYWAHTHIDHDGLHQVIISFTNVYIIRKKHQWATWDIEWKVPLDCIVAVPTIENQKLIFTITEDEGDKIGSNKYELSSENILKLIYLKNKIEQVMILKIQDEQWCA